MSAVAKEPPLLCAFRAADSRVPHHLIPYIVHILGPKLALSVDDIAEMTGLGRTFLYQRINLMSLKAIKPTEGRTLILVWDLVDWLLSLPAYGLTRYDQEI